MSATLNITAPQRKILLDLLQRYIPDTTVWAYGSRVKGTSRPNSDLDLVVFTNAEQDRQVSDLKDALAESNIPFLVDVHVWDEIPARFHDIIRKDYLVICESKKKS